MVIIFAFLVVSQQGAWMPLDVEMPTVFGANRIAMALADLASVFTQAMADPTFDLPHTSIVVD
jgi:hypothetical protein